MIRIGDPKIYNKRGEICTFEIFTILHSRHNYIRAFKMFGSVFANFTIFLLLLLPFSQILNSQFREIASFPGVLLIVLGENRLIK